MLTEGNYKAEFLLSEANGTQSRDQITVASGQNLTAGTVIGKITADGKYAAYADGASDGTETAAGIILADVDASAADAEGVIINGNAEVSGDLLVGNDANGTADLEALKIKIR